MNLKLKLFMICLCLLFLLFVYKKVEKGNLQLKYSFPWYAIVIILIIISIFDTILIPIRNFFGFETVSNMILVIGFATLAMLTFSLTTKVSELQSKNTKLTQELALLKKEVEKDGHHKKNDR